jgi:hypothetical protein
VARGAYAPLRRAPPRHYRAHAHAIIRCVAFRA